MMGWHGGTGWGAWLLMAAGMVAFWGLVILAVIAIFRGLGATRNEATEQTPVRDALRILDERFARGELDVEEYHARQNALRGTGR